MYTGSSFPYSKCRKRSTTYTVVSEFEMLVEAGTAVGKSTGTFCKGAGYGV